MREAGVEDVPSLDTLRQRQEYLRKKISIQTQQRMSSEGNIYCTNDLNAQIAEDFANPLVCKYMVFYPEEKEGCICEAWHGKKWVEGAHQDALTPMAVGNGGRHYYVNELAMCHDGTFAIPLRWIILDGKMTCAALRAKLVSLQS